ncbi:MAG TPA: FAD-binding oxidoreductase, partial [Thermoanaerobaculia bacterium]|nr:FAD-binding oxidoreductase [Thermoanaerobaculia bacterium]
RFLDFDEPTGVLTAEGGASLSDVVDLFLPRGFFLPVTPGTRFVTLAGAIANDVHGKNHHVAGTFSRFVTRLTLLTPKGDVLSCSPSENADVFFATAGGAGLTGVILDASLKLKRVDSDALIVDFKQLRDLDATLEAVDATDRNYEYSVAWIDALAKGRSLGRTVLMQGNHAPATGEKRRAGSHGTSIPFDLPSGLLNHATVALFNEAYFRFHRDGTKRVGFDSFFYPLDSLEHWNRLYGKRGFVQYQAALPTASSRAGLIALLTRVAAAGSASFLAVLKRFGPSAGGPLSFPVEGYTLALDIPVSPSLPALLRELDALLLSHGGRLYLAKDAATTSEAFAAMYPRLREFQELKSRLDPKGLFSSSQARRLGIVPAGEAPA